MASRSREVDPARHRNAGERAGNVGRGQDCLARVSRGEPSPAKPDTAATSPTISNVPDDPPALPTSHAQPPPPEPAREIHLNRNCRHSPRCRPGAGGSGRSLPVPAVPEDHSRCRRSPDGPLPVPPVPEGSLPCRRSRSRSIPVPPLPEPPRPAAAAACTGAHSPTEPPPPPPRPPAPPAPPPAPPVPVLTGARLELHPVEAHRAAKNQVQRCTPVVGVSVQVCVAQAAPVPVAAIAHVPTSGPVCVSACSSSVVALVAATRS